MKRILIMLALLMLGGAIMASCNSQDLTTETQKTTTFPDVTGTSSAVGPEDTAGDTSAGTGNDSEATGGDTSDISSEDTEKQPVSEAIDLSFNSLDCCSSKYAPSYSEGTLSRWDRWFSTEYIDISGYYGLSYELASHKYLISLSFFDADKQYISGIGTTSTSNCSTVNGFTVVPEGAVWARCVTFTGISSDAAFQTPSLTGFETEEDYNKATSAYPDKDLVIACIGDSLTEGDIGAFISGPDVKYRNYPYYLSKQLGCEVINYGKCGYTAQSYLAFYRQGNVDITRADIILVMLGTNAGLKRGGTVQYNSYLELIDEIKADMKEGAELILITPPYASANKSTSASFVANVNEAAETVLEIAESLGIKVIDAHNDSPIQEAKENIYQPNDGLHMVEAGYSVFAEYIAGALSELVEK